MVTIKILQKDKTVHWSQSFSDPGAAKAWLADEQTRPYWDESYDVQIIDTTDADLAAQQAAKQQAAQQQAALDVKKAQILAAKAKGAALTAPEIITLLGVLVDYLGIAP